MSTSVAAVRRRRCCRCNGAAKCLRCACVRSNSPCSHCLPGEVGNCHNTLPRNAPPSATSSTHSVSSSPPSQGASVTTTPSPTVVVPSLSSIFRSSITTLQHVPKGARDSWARVLGDCLCTVVTDPADITGWTRLFMLPKCILASPSAGHRLRWREILALVRSRIKRWAEGDLSALWSEAEAGALSLSKQSTSATQNSINSRRARAATQCGQYSKAIKALTSEGLAPPSSTILEEMRAKHPQAPPPTLPSDPVPPAVIVNESIVRRCVRSFPNGSAPGPSGLRPSHLREAVGCPSPDQAKQLLTALTRFVNCLASGQTSSAITPYLCGATLLASKKKNGGHRPIAVGEVLRRLVSKCLASITRHQALHLLPPLQLGVGVKGGCEAIIHATNNLISSLCDDDHWTLLLDFTNAFNSISRQAMFMEFRHHLPGLSAWMESCYSSQPLLIFGQETILSCCGVQQGDPLGPLGFALTLHPIVQRIRDEVSGLSLNAWYLDDGTLVGSPRDLSAALNMVESEGHSIGLHLNRSKSLLYIPSTSDPSLSPLPPEIPVAREGFCLLGCPIGPPAFCDEVLQGRVRKIRESLERLHDMQDSHLETTLLRSCLALPKFAYALRTCPPSFICQATYKFDSAIRETLESILGGPLSEWSWCKASLPSSRGGINLRSATLHAPSAFLASEVRAKQLVEKMVHQPLHHSCHLDSTVSALSVAASRPDWQCLDDIDVPLKQNSLSIAIDEAVYQHLLSTAPTSRERALVLSSALPHAGDWLNGIPSPALGLHLQDQEFRCCLRYWLGVPLHSSPYQCPECHLVADPFGDHQVGCGGNGDRITRHNAVRDVIFSAAQSAALAPSKEMPNLIPDSSSRPADVFLPIWSRGRPLAIDVQVISPLQQQIVGSAALAPGHALQVGVQRKLTSHLSACRAIGVEFLPFVAETLGGLAEDAISVLRSLGKALTQRVGYQDDSSVCTKQLFHRTAIALWRGNASLWLHRLPPLHPSIDGFV